MTRKLPVVVNGAMDHDPVKENWSRQPNKQPGCICPPWRYHPRYPKPTNPECPEHGGAL